MLCTPAFAKSPSAIEFTQWQPVLSTSQLGVNDEYERPIDECSLVRDQQFETLRAWQALHGIAESDDALPDEMSAEEMNSLFDSPQAFITHDEEVIETCLDEDTPQRDFAGRSYMMALLSLPWYFAEEDGWERWLERYQDRFPEQYEQEYIYNTPSCPNPGEVFNNRFYAFVWRPGTAVSADGHVAAGLNFSGSDAVGFYPGLNPFGGPGEYRSDSKAISRIGPVGTYKIGNVWECSCLSNAEMAAIPVRLAANKSLAKAGKLNYGLMYNCIDAFVSVFGKYIGLKAPGGRQILNTAALIPALSGNLGGNGHCKPVASFK